MAVSLKRSLFEPSQSIQEHSTSIGRSHKRIRLALKRSTTNVSISTYTNLLESSTHSNEALKILIQISDVLQFNEEDNTESIRQICEHFRKETDSSAVRVKVLSLLSEFCLESCVTDCATLAEDIMILLRAEKSPKVISQGLLGLYKIGDHQPLPTQTLSKILSLAKVNLTSSSHNVQRHALLLLGAFTSLAEAERETLNLVSKYTDSQDSRVRAQAFRSILMMGHRNVILTPSLYPRAVSSLHDDYECVRREALQLVYELGIRHPNHMIAVSDSDSELRLIDAAFGNVCSAICDLSMRVRTQAAELLGGMAQVGNEFLHQTLDKKLMSNLRRKKSFHERSTELFQSGEWSTGKKWADDAPKEEVNKATVSLMASGACGALVHGLEDEFLEVRTASVDSMCRLALTNPPFAVTSLDFLVDMFNDEIESVRLRAIYSLTKISKHIILREDQLETMLSSLEDYAVEVREGLHLMLGACKVSTQSCLLMVVQKVLDVLSKYPQDKMSAFGCLQRVGQKHAELCLSLVPQLLQNHPFLDSAEKDVEDPAYVCILIMLFNAAPLMPPMLSLMPETTIKHYAYLRDTMPNLVPHLAVGGASHHILTGQTGSRQFLETLLANIQAAYKAPRARQALLHAAQDNLDRLAAIDPELSGTANYTATFLGAQLLIEQLQSNLVTPNSRSPSKESLNQLMKKCLKLQNLFSGLTPTDLLMVKQVCLRASALHLVLVVKDRSQSALGPCQLLLHISADASHFLQENPNMTPDPFTVSILIQIANLNDPKPGRVFREILPLVQAAPPVMSPEINVNIKICTARILEPSATMSSENVVKVTAGLIAAMPFVAEIQNLREGQRHDLRLRIKYPDQNVHFVVPRMRDLKQIMTEYGVAVDHNIDYLGKRDLAQNTIMNHILQENDWRLRTTVLLSHGVWTEATQVDISLCLFVRPGHELELCKPVKVLFAPKPVKRGI